jgi:hypothetical protein
MTMHDGHGRSVSSFFAVARGAVFAMAACVPFAALGCAAAPESAEDGEVAAIDQAFGESSCAVAQPDTWFDPSLPYDSARVPTNYNNRDCPKAFVIGFDQPVPAGAAFDIHVGWLDRWERNEAQCLGSYIAVDIYADGYHAGPFTATSQWTNGKCVYGQITVGDLSGDTSGRRSQVYFTYGDTLGAKKKFQTLTGRQGLKIAVTARTPRGSTQPAWVDYLLW